MTDEIVQDRHSSASGTEAAAGAGAPGVTA